MKGVRITEEQEERGVQLFQQGWSYAQIEEKAGFSKAKLSEVIQERAQGDPDLWKVHEIAKYLKEKKVAVETLLRGESVLERIEGAGSSLDEVCDAVIPFLQRAQGNAVSYCENGEAYQELVRTTGLTFPKLKTEYEITARERERVAEEVKEKKMEVASLEKRIEELALRLRHLQDLEAIYDGLRRIGKTPAEGARILERSEGHLKLGLSMATLDKISAELRRAGARSADAPSAIAKLLAKYANLDEAIRGRENVLRAKEKQEARLDNRISVLKGRVKGLNDQIGALRVGRDELSSGTSRLRRSYAALNRAYAIREKNLETNFSQLHEKMEGDYKARRDALERDYVQRKQRLEADLSTERETRVAEIQSAVATEERNFERKKRAHEILASEFSREEQELQNRVSRLRQEERTKQYRILAAEALWSYVKDRKPAAFRQLAALYQPGGYYEKLPIPDGFRKVLMGAMEELGMNDSLFKIEEKEKELAQVARDVRHALKTKWLGVRAMERDTAILVQLRLDMKAEQKAVDNADAILTEDPAYLARVLENSSDSFLVDVFMRMNILAGYRFRVALKTAEERFDAQLNSEFESALIGMLAREKVSLSRSQMGYPVLPWQRQSGVRNPAGSARPPA